VLTFRRKIAIVGTMRQFAPAFPYFFVTDAAFCSDGDGFRTIDLAVQTLPLGGAEARGGHGRAPDGRKDYREEEEAGIRL
jgi:hypothetical protein